MKFEIVEDVIIDFSGIANEEPDDQQRKTLQGQCSEKPFIVTS